MTASFVIKPDVINILCGDPSPVRRGNVESQPQQGAKRQTFWNKVGSFFKKTWAYFVAALGVLPPTINALARYKDACNRSKAKGDGTKGKGE